MGENNLEAVASFARNIESFIKELYSNEFKKTVLIARANGESLEEIGIRLGVTREFVRQAEAKIIRKFTLSQGGKKILNTLSILNDPNAVCTLKALLGEHYCKMIYLLHLYKESSFYDGVQLENVPLDEAEDGVEQSLKYLLGIDDETLAALRQWLFLCEQGGEPVDYDKIGQWLAENKAKR